MRIAVVGSGISGLAAAWLLQPRHEVTLFESGKRLGGGCEFPIVTRDYRFAQEVKSLTNGRGADVIYDGLGRDAAAENLEALALTGHWACYGQASGPFDKLPDLSAKSGTLSRPVLFHYTAERATLQEIAGNVFRALRERTIRVELRHRFPLSAAAEAHRELEARRTTGSIVLLP